MIELVTSSEEYRGLAPSPHPLTEERPHEHSVGRQQSTSQEERPHQKLN